METPNQNPEGESEQNLGGLQESALAPLELSPLNIIRTETVISRLPIHNLSKKGRINIQIVRKTSKGEIALKWEVSYSERHGQPRQLAYKLDTVIINRKIDELHRPLPEIICLGSLREIAHKLNLGGNTNKVRLALRQNAFASITAKLKYKGNDGSERSLEADFTRYSVIFTGERLPDGRKAEAVYVILNAPYREVLNNAPVRPLDYDYLKQLPPAAQRFYEIVSRKVFAAIKYGHPHAKLSYSEFCELSAQQRQIDYDHFKKQMYKVHRPHMKSGYITKVEYEASTDEEGKRDWLMLYTPGPKAHTEFQTFNGLPIRTRRTRQRRIPASTPADVIEKIPSSTNDVQNDTPSQPTEKSREGEQKFLASLTERGIFESTARKLLAPLKPEQLESVGDYINYWDSIPGDKKTPGLLHSLIQNNDPLPANFETRRKRAERLAAEEHRRNLQLVTDALENAYDDYRKEALDRYIAEVIPAGEYERRVALRKQEDAKQRNLSDSWVNPDMIERIAHHYVRAEIAKSVSVMPLDDFRRRELPRILAELRLNPAEFGLSPKAEPIPEDGIAQDAV